MVKLWPFGGDANLAESFERTLSTLTQKIQKTSAQNDRLRQRSRKVKVSWTIYGGFTYILTALIFILVTGWQNWGVMEYSVVTGGPVLLWGVRRTLSLYYEWRIGNSTEYLKGLEKERDATIEKLKLATKYNSTQQLIDKYSSKPSTPSKSPEGGEKKGKRQSGGSAVPGQGQQQRVFTQPPPTANIPRGPQPLPPQHIQNRPLPLPAHQQQPPQPLRQETTAEFAPNAFSEPAPSAPASYGAPTWYDRILDALLGEDETSAKNRFALICSQCTLVNGQAPPGARTPEDVGKWRCSACGAMNGVESEVKKLVNATEKAEKAEKRKHDVSGLDVPDVDGANEVSDEEEEDIKVVSEESDVEGEETVESPAASTRSKTKGGGKKK